MTRNPKLMSDFLTEETLSFMANIEGLKLRSSSVCRPEPPKTLVALLKRN